MIKKLRFSKIDLVERAGALMLVTFLDDDGNMYQWAPKWADVEQVFLKQINIERFNKPESEWLNKFAQTAQKVVEGAQRIESAYKVSGWFKRCDEQKLILATNKVEYKLTPGFEVSLDFLDNWLGNYVEAFVINDIVIRFRHYDEGFVSKEYPELEPKDIPFESETN
jgi:hypothetical protein